MFSSFLNMHIHRIQNLLYETESKFNKLIIYYLGLE